MKAKWNSSMLEKDGTVRACDLWAGDLRIVVTRYIGMPGTWVLKCVPFFDGLDLRTHDLKVAKEKALCLIGDKMSFAAAVLQLAARKKKR